MVLKTMVYCLYCLLPPPPPPPNFFPAESQTGYPGSQSHKEEVDKRHKTLKSSIM